MLRPRELREDEAYFRYAGPLPAAQGSTNLAQVSAPFRLAPNQPGMVYYIPTLSITMVGENLLTNLHQFGMYAGQFSIESWVQDEIGTLWDRWSMSRHSLAGAEDWLSGSSSDVTMLSQFTSAGLRPNIGPITASYVAPSSLAVARSTWAPLIGLAPVAVPSWTSQYIPFSVSDEVTFVAWKFNDCADKHGNALRKLRIDLEYSFPGSGANLVSLTHWPNAAVPAPLPNPVAVPLPPPLGTAIPQVFSQRSRALQIRCSQFRIFVYIDPTDPAILAPTHVDDLISRPPALSEICIYGKNGDRLVRALDNLGNPVAYATDSGRRRKGQYSSVQEILEHARDPNPILRANAYGGRDLIKLEMPASSRLSADGQECLVGRFIPDNAGNSLTLFEVKATDGLARFDQER